MDSLYDKIKKQYEGRPDDLLKEYVNLLTKRWTPELVQDYEKACEREAQLILDDIKKAETLDQKEALWGQLANYAQAQFKMFDQFKNGAKP